MSENYRSVGSYDGLRRAGGATDATIPGSAHYSSEVLTRKNMAGDWMFEHYQDYPNAQQLAQAASTKYDIGVAELMSTATQFYDAKDGSSITQRIDQLQRDLVAAERRGDQESVEHLRGEIARMERREREEGPHAGADKTGFELNPNNSPFKREPQPAPQATPVSEVAARIRVKQGEQKDETPLERATRQQHAGEGLPVGPSRPLRPDEDALMSHEEVSHMLNAQIVRKGMEKEEGHLKAGKPKFAEEEHERTARALKHGVTRAWEHTMGDE